VREDVTVVPVGGLDKLATFVALLGGNQLEMVVLHDYVGRREPRLESLVRDKIVHERHVLNYAAFRAPAPAGRGKKKENVGGLVSPDVEDLFSPDLYLSMFNAAFAKQLGGRALQADDLPPGDRIVERIGRFLQTEGIAIRPSGGFNHYAVANYLAANPQAVDDATLNRFERLFAAVNPLFSSSR
jgi:hypothetical protein